MKLGMVYLVGAGPGDPELLTLKAKRVLESANLVIMDYLANPAHLTHANPKAKIISVGKGFRHKKIAQERIHQLILSYAKKASRSCA